MVYNGKRGPFLGLIFGALIGRKIGKLKLPPLVSWL